MPDTLSRHSSESLADLLDRLGGVSPQRVRLRPPPGTATEDDVIDAERRESRLCELVDGVLVEKAMGFRESLIALAIGRLLGNFVSANRLGVVAGADGMVRLAPGLVRIPDVAFVSWARLPEGCVPSNPIPDLVPDLAVEVLSAANTEAEMARKRSDYFDAGVKCLWIVDIQQRRVDVWENSGSFRTLDSAGTLDGGALLPGFTLPLHELFAELDATPGKIE